jgi:ABC-type branched-subunit amino acid transport system substrate-binding protein
VPRRSIIAAATVGSVLVGIVTPFAASGVASAATDSAPIVVGGDGNLAISPGVAQGFEAGIYRFNKAGGLDGRKIEFTGFLDDGFSSQTNLTNAQQLVGNKHVMVVAPYVSEVATSATATYLAGQKVPFIGWAVNSAFGTEPKWGYGITGYQNNPNAQSVSSATAVIDYTHNTKTPSKVKVAFMAENVAGGIQSMKALAGAFKYEKTSVVYTGSPMPVIGTTDYSPYAQDIISSGANVAFEVLDSADSVGLAAALKADGFKGTIVNGVTYLPGELSSQPNEAAALEGTLVEDEFPADENDTPATKQAIADLKAIGQPGYLVSGTSIGYWSAILLEQMLKATLAAEGNDPAKVTGATIEKTVNSGHYVYTPPLAGGINTMYFPAAENVPTGCGTLVEQTGTTYKQFTPYECQGVVNVSGQRLYNLQTGK